MNLFGRQITTSHITGDGGKSHYKRSKKRDFHLSSWLVIFSYVSENWVKCDHRSHYFIPSWWNRKVQKNRDLNESSEIPPVEEMDEEEEISESPKDSGRDTTGYYEMEPDLIIAPVYGFGNQVVELTTLLSTCASYMNNKDPLAKLRNQRGKSMIAWRVKELTTIQVQSVSTSPRIYGGGEDRIMR